MQGTPGLLLARSGALRLLAAAALVATCGCLGSGQTLGDQLGEHLCFLGGGTWWPQTHDDLIGTTGPYCTGGDRHRKSATARPGDTLFVAASAHVAGAQGTNWRSDVELHSLGDEPAVVTLSLLVHGADNSSPQQRDLTLAPGASVRLADVLDAEFAFEGQAALVVAPSAGRIAVSSRTYNLLGDGNDLGLPAGATFGQAIPALPSSEAIAAGSEGRLIQLSHQTTSDQGARTNLGLVNASGAPLRVQVELYLADGTLLGAFGPTLAPLEYRQFNRVFERVTSGEVADGFAVVRPVTDGGRLFAFASVVDNLTGDPVAITAVPDQDAVSGEPLYIVAGAHVRGAADTDWRTDVEVHCPGPEPASYTVELLEHGRNNSSPVSRTYTLEPGHSERFGDMLFTEFGLEGQAALRITATSGRVMVTSRTYNLLGAGNSAGLPAGATFGQYIPGVPARAAIGFGGEGRLIQLSQDPGETTGFRTNLVLVNAVGQRIDVAARLYDASGTLLGTVDRSLAPFEYRQLNKVFESVTGGPVADGYAVVSTTTEGGAFFALASVVDNLTGDPVGMGAREILSEAAEGLLDAVGTTVDVAAAVSIGAVVDAVRAAGVDGVLDTVVAADPGIASRTPDGVVFDWGDGTVATDGSVWAGSATIDAGDLTVTSSAISGTVSVSHEGVTVDGEPPLLGPMTWGFDLATRGDGSVAGTVTVGAAAKSVGSVSGTIAIDTAICLDYPVGGSLTFNLGSEVVTVRFGPDCDGGLDQEISPGDVVTYSYGSPTSPAARTHLVDAVNAEVGQEGSASYWRPMVGGEELDEAPPGIVTYHFPFDRTVVGGTLQLELSVWHFSYSRGHAFAYGSRDGVDWQQLAEVAPPDFGMGRGGGFNGDLPAFLTGGSDIWLRVELVAYGPNAAAGGIYCNTAEHSRWDANGPRDTFSLEVILDD